MLAMQYVYHAYAVFETDDKTIEMDGVVVADNPIADEQSYEALRQHIRADHGLPKIGTLIIKSLNFLHDATIVSKKDS